MVEEGKRNIEFKTQPDEEPFDVQAVRPRYEGAMMSDVARALFIPRSPEASTALKKLCLDAERIKTHI